MPAVPYRGPAGNFYWYDIVLEQQNRPNISCANFKTSLLTLSHTGVERPMFSPNFIGEPVDEAATLSNLVGLLGVRSVGSVNRLSTLCGVTGRSALIALARRCTTLQFV